MFSLKRSSFLVLFLAVVFCSKAALVLDPSKDSVQILNALKTNSVLEVSSAMEVFLTFGDQPSYRFVASPSIVPLLQIKNDGGVTSFYLKDSDVSRYVRDMKLYVTLPMLSQLKLTGATKTTIIGRAVLHEIFTLDVSGSSVVVGEQLAASKMRVYLSGSSNVSVPIKGDDVKIDLTGASVFNGQVEGETGAFYLSGASSVKLTGAVAEAKVYASGASTLNGSEFMVSDLFLNLSGASTAKIKVVESIKYDISGMSRLHYSGTPKILGANVSGMSTVKSL